MFVDHKVELVIITAVGMLSVCVCLMADGRRNIRLLLEYEGSAEFVQVLCERLGAERCPQATYGLHLLKKRVERYQLQGEITNVAIRNK